ncbi:uncharacterized protein [Onthophagus taurus]|uniref:uncharacterized protein n=1 Tax=Onthophagus taurus TaxID=166361 RepID=UPI0039BDC8B5
MFFDVQLLCYQSDGLFWMAWVAGIFGTKSSRTSALLKLEDRHVKSANVARLCDSLQKYLSNGSSQVNERMSLRLSAILTLGIIRIHSRKIDLYQYAINRIFDKIQRPLIAGLMEKSKPGLKDKKKRAGKKAVAELLPEIDGDIQPVVIPEYDAIVEGGLAALENIHVASVEQITMPEDVPTRDTEELENMGFGDEIDKVAQLIITSTDFRQPGGFEKAIADIEAAIPTSHQEPLSPPEKSSEADAGKRKRTTSDEIEISKRQRLEEAPSVPVANLQEELEVPIETPPQDVVSKRGKKKYLLDVVEKKLVPKNKQWVNEIIYASSFFKLNPPLNVGKDFDLYECCNDILEVYKIRPIAKRQSPSVIQEDMRAVDSNVASGQLSTQLEQHRGSSTVSPQVGTPSLPPRTPQESLIQPVALQYLDKAGAHPVHSTPIVPARPAFTPREQPIIEEEVEISAIHLPRDEAEDEDVSSRVQSQQNRIVEIVKNWNFEESILTIDDLCPIPINRRNIGVTFIHLTVLCKRELVDLEHKHDSLELEKILPGPKLLSLHF